MLRPSPFEARIRSHLRVTDHRSRNSFSRCVSAPELCHATILAVTTDLTRCSMPSCSTQMPVEAFVSAASARMTNGKNEKRIGGETPTDARSSLPRLTGTAAPLSGEAHIYRRSTAALAPRSLSSQGTQHQARLPATWRGHVLRIPLSGRYPPLPVPVQRRTSRSGHNAGEMMPNAARERVASPRAGTALASRSPAMPAGPRPIGRDTRHM
jgi:hypothetical protein